MPHKYNELDLQVDVCNYIRLQYPEAKDLIFSAILGSVTLRSKALMGKAKAAGNARGYPDLIIDYPIRGYHGMRLELKMPDKGPLTTKGSFRTGAEGERMHYQAQRQSHLRKHGFYSCFACGFQAAESAIDFYMTGVGRLKPIEITHPITKINYVIYQEPCR